MISDYELISILVPISRQGAIAYCGRMIEDVPRTSTEQGREVLISEDGRSSTVEQGTIRYCILGLVANAAQADQGNSRRVQRIATVGQRALSKAFRSPRLPRPLIAL